MISAMDIMNAVLFARSTGFMGGGTSRRINTRQFVRRRIPGVKHIGDVAYW